MRPRGPLRRLPREIEIGPLAARYHETIVLPIHDDAGDPLREQRERQADAPGGNREERLNHEAAAVAVGEVEVVAVDAVVLLKGGGFAALADGQRQRAGDFVKRLRGADVGEVDDEFEGVARRLHDVGGHGREPRRLALVGVI